MQEVSGRSVAKNNPNIDGGNMLWIANIMANPEIDMRQW
jgi:hypothetical protein